MRGKKSIRAKTSLKIQNIVATVSLEKEIPLTKLTKIVANTEYNPEQFPGLVLRLKEPKSAVLIFSSGNLVCAGARSLAQLKKVVEEVVKILRKINIRILEKPKIKIQNIVASGNIHMNLNLNYLSLALENTEYEPEQFPGLVYKLIEPTSTFLLFSNGKFVCTGTKNNKQLEEAMKQLIKTIKKANENL